MTKIEKIIKPYQNILEEWAASYEADNQTGEKQALQKQSKNKHVA